MQFREVDRVALHRGFVVRAKKPAGDTANIDRNRMENPAELLDGKKTITATVHFWTNNIAKDKGKILPKHAWASGAVFIDSNKAHGTTPMDPLPFNSMAELPFAVERALVKAGIILHMDGRMKKYLT